MYSVRRESASTQESELHSNCLTRGTLVVVAVRCRSEGCMVALDLRTEIEKDDGTFLKNCLSTCLALDTSCWTKREAEAPLNPA